MKILIFVRARRASAMVEGEGGRGNLLLARSWRGVQGYEAAIHYLQSYD